MIAASLYITVCSAKNRIRARLRRLREPRYLIGAAVGIAYLYFGFFARSRTSRSSAARRAARGAAAVPPAVGRLLSVIPVFTGLFLLGVTVVSWIVPVNSGLLDFSEAEVQFLFPAPVSRKQLLVHRMLRSQIGLLFASVIVGIAAPSVGGYTRLRLSVAMWILLVTVKIYFTGITLARARLLSASTRVRRVAWMPVAVLLAATAVVVAAVARAFVTAPPQGPLETLTRVSDAATHGAAAVVLWPFMAMTRPLFAAWPQPYLSGLATAAGVLVFVVVWVLQSDQAFQDAAADAAARRAAQPSRAKGNYRVRAGGWTLMPAGRPEVAFAWKSAMQTMRVVDWRTFARIGAALLALTLATTAVGRARGFVTIFGLFVTLGAAFSILLGPQALRIDMRQDLAHLEVLKTWPIASAAVVRGELLWPGLLLTCIAWTLMAAALPLSVTVFPSVALTRRIFAALGVAIAVPSLIFAQLTIHNAAALIFPAWVPLGMQRARGLDALGQRLITVFATFLALIVMVLPGIIAGGIVWFAARGVMGDSALVPGALAGAGIVAIEVLLATEALGPAYERIDVTGVERAE